MTTVFFPHRLLVLCFLLSLPYLAFSQWATSGNNIYNTNSGRVLIGGYDDTSSKLTLGGRMSIIGYNETIRSSFVTSDNANSTFRIAHPSTGVAALGGNVDHQLQLGGFVYDGSSFSPRMTINTNGNVGVGTTTASHKMTVQSTDDNTLRLIGPDGAYGYGGSLNFGDGDYVYLRESTDDRLTLYSSGTSILGGNVGIGTATPTKGRLQVKGSLHVEDSNENEIFHVSPDEELVFIGAHAYDEYIASGSGGNIQSDSFALWVSRGIVSEDFAVAYVQAWDDYVFADDYQLPSLESVAHFVKANKHLPNIPSEAEVKQQGYSLHQLNRGFLKTIEELTLHTIAQEEKIKTLEKQVRELEALAAEVAELKVLMKRLEE